MTDVDQDLAKQGGEGAFQGWVEGGRLHCKAVVRSLCGNIVLMIAFDLALYLSLYKSGKLAQLVGKELIRHGNLGGTNFTAPKQSGGLTETEIIFKQITNPRGQL